MRADDFCGKVLLVFCTPLGVAFSNDVEELPDFAAELLLALRGEVEVADSFLGAMTIKMGAEG
jgi:hypothetical protein